MDAIETPSASRDSTPNWKMLIGGEWKDAVGGAKTTLIDPSTGNTLGTVPKGGKDDAKAAIDAAREAFDKGPWPRMAPKARAAVLAKAGTLLSEQAETFALWETKNAGKPIRQSTFFDVALAAEHLAFFGELAGKVRQQRIRQPDIEGSHGLVIREPVGVCAGITPWNLPLLMAVWKAGPALAAGNTVILKPASLTPVTTLELARVFQEAGLPPGALQVITGPGGEIGQILASHSSVDKVSFTGSTEVGREVLALAAPTVKRTTLELGGKSANIILPDADLDKATDGAIFGIFLHSGQLCESGSRLLVPAKLHDKIIGMLQEKVRRIRLGLTQDFETDMGPLISEGQRKRVEGYIQYGIDQGAQLIVGGGRSDAPELRRGYYLRPTIFGQVKADMTIAQEEIFGPVLAVLPYENVDDAVDISNQTIYGLAGAVWSTNIRKAQRVAMRMRTGTVWINDYHMLSCHAPRGGYKQSGLGRELGENALEEFSEVKHLYFDEKGALVPIARGLVLPPTSAAPDTPSGKSSA